MAVMEQNNFEKNVQGKLDELKIPPSDSVWVNIEKRIGKKNKDRKPIFILFFFILVFLCAAYWLFNSSKNDGQSKNQLTELKKDSKATNNKNSFLEKNETSINRGSKNPDSTTLLMNNIKTSSTKNKNKSSITTQKPVVAEAQTERKPVIFLSNNKNKSGKNENKFSNKVNSNSTIGGNESSAQKPHLTTTDSVLEKKEIAKDSSEKYVSQVSKKKSKKLTGKTKDDWNIGFTFSSGTSMMKENSSLRSAFFASNPYNNSGGIPSYYSPTEIKNSIGFIAGIYAEKNISGKKKISIGISYKYFSLLNKVGNRIDSSFSFPPSFSLLNTAYSSAANLKTYQNNFQFIEVPISIEFQLNNNSKLPIFWEAGINISELISSNALQFNSNAGLYYSDNSFFNKTGFGVNTSLSVTFFDKAKIPFNIGPYFYYSGTSLANKGLYDKKHFSFIGIKAEILLRKN